MHPVEYLYPRGLELEGRHPADAGVWQQTIQRLQGERGCRLVILRGDLCKFRKADRFPPRLGPRLPLCSEFGITDGFVPPLSAPGIWTLRNVTLSLLLFNLLRHGRTLRME
jgi:hypothetical protein